MCSEFKRHLLHFSCIPHCQILLPPVIWMLNYCWHGYARKENAKPEPQIIADPFKVPKPLMRSLMQRLFSKADSGLTTLFLQAQEQAPAMTLWKQPLVRVTNQYMQCDWDILFWLNHASCNIHSFSAALLDPWHHGKRAKSEPPSLQLASGSQMCQATLQILLL